MESLREFSFFMTLEAALSQDGPDRAKTLAMKTMDRALRIIAATEQWAVDKLGCSLKESFTFGKVADDVGNASTDSVPPSACR